MKKNNTSLSFGQKMADKVAAFGGSWAFILSCFFMMLVWIASNTYLLLDDAFDPYPYILLNLILSCVSSLQAPIIMMSQKRQEEKDRERATKDYQINLKAEAEIKQLKNIIEELTKEQNQQLDSIKQTQQDILKALSDK